ncbi:hypothetical protein COV25_00980 [candidate division WWE3 bacterium CG10_big_fil_rev_8_21_14_0_10_35_32]|nr:MAG: hypothetical protein COV25_00980 [candidate division WWE3 bacterium CG10_big_fil_rev_8_21_14_0_10_35_32]
MPNFKTQVIKIINSIPRGKVASYGQIAVYAGAPRAARAIGMILNRLPSDTKLPWWRIVNNKGKLTIRGSIFNRNDQQSLLQAEGVQFKKEYEFKIEEYRL